MLADYLKLFGKIAVVTGGARGIGEDIACSLAHYGAKVMVCDIKDDLGVSVVQKILNDNGNAEYCHCDVSNPKSIEKMVNKTLDYFGKIDILVNDAGIGSQILPFEEISDEEWDKIMHVDLAGPFYVTRAIIPYMKKQKYGKIINISSGSGVIGEPFCAHYATAKAGLIGFTESIAKELAMYRINANVIAVPTTDTPMLSETDFDISIKEEIKEIPWGRIAVTKDISDMVLYLSSDASEYVTGQCLAPNGGRHTPM